MRFGRARRGDPNAGPTEEIGVEFDENSGGRWSGLRAFVSKFGLEGGGLRSKCISGCVFASVGWEACFRDVGWLSTIAFSTHDHSALDRWLEQCRPQPCSAELDYFFSCNSFSRKVLQCQPIGWRGLECQREAKMPKGLGARAILRTARRRQDA